MTDIVAAPLYDNGGAVFNVKHPDFGAKGDGSTDDTAAIAAAITAATTTGGIVFLPAGVYVVSSQLVLPAGVSLIGSGMGAGASTGSRIKWTGTSGFCIKAGNTASTLSYGIEIANLGINVMNTAASALWLYGVAHLGLTNIYIEGQSGTTATIGVQIDGASASAFFILMQNVTCNHVFKGFVHTTTGSVQPTQVIGSNCTSNCDNTSGSIGIDIQSVAGVGCGDGVTYLGGNMEACKIGVYTNAGGTTIMGMRFENPQGTSEDIKFDTLARNNQVIGAANVYTITNVSGSYTNQVLAVSKDRTNVISQENVLDATTIKTLTVAGTIVGTPTIGASSNLVFAPNSTAARRLLVNASGTYTGSFGLQAGGGSAGFGGGVVMYGHSHATHPGDVVAGISSSSGGKFRVNNSGIDGGTDYLAVDANGLTVRTTQLMATTTALTNGAAASTGTLTNAPAAGNPTKWVPINDNGTTRYIPAW